MNAATKVPSECGSTTKECSWYCSLLLARSAVSVKTPSKPSRRSERNLLVEAALPHSLPSPDRPRILCCLWHHERRRRIHQAKRRSFATYHEYLLHYSRYALLP